MPKNENKYETVNLLKEKKAELQVTADELSAEEGAPVSVPALIYRMHKQFTDQRKAAKAVQTDE